jgi:hypothetical protein
MPGIYITKGMTVSVPKFSIRVRDDGSIDGDPIILHLRFDVCPTWVQIANRHLEAAKAAQEQRRVAWAGSDEQAKTQSLEAEFEASMQAIMAAAIAWDAAYSVLREHVDIPPSMAKRWRTGRTARYSQITEIVRRAFNLKPKSVAALRANLKEIYRFRDLAVHPSGKVKAAIHHPELDVGVEWRFVAFRASNAELAVTGAGAMLWELAHHGKAKEPRITEYQTGLAKRLGEIFPEGPPKVSSGTVVK